MEKEESFKIIEEMISTARQEVGNDSYLYLSWGYLVLVASLLHYFLMGFTDFSMPWLPWPVLMTLGGVNQFIAVYRKNRDKRSSSTIERMLAYLWISVFIGLMMILALVGYNEFVVQHTAHLTYVLVLIMYGIGTFVSGGILKFTPLILGGIASWVIAIVAYQVSFDVQLLLIALAIILSYILPGHMLGAKRKAVHV